MEENLQQRKHLKRVIKRLKKFTSFFNEHLDNRTIFFLNYIVFNVLVTTQCKEPWRLMKYPPKCCISSVRVN